MKVFIVLSCIALAAAKPQGYSYSQPGGSFSNGGSGSFSTGLNVPSTASAPVFNSGGASFGGSGSSQSFVGSSQSFSSPSSSFSGSFGSGSSGSGSFGSGSSGSGSFGSGSLGSGSFGSGSSGSFGSGPSGSFGSGPSSSFGAEQAVVQKHIYVHVPPPDQEEFRQSSIPIAPIQKQKHYKIIFIKAPSAPSYSSQVLQRQQVQNEEKTLVYVLVKKPESLNEIQQLIPSAPPTAPSKPEVYFIKYKAQKEQGSSGPILSGPISSGPISSGPISSGPILSGPISSGHIEQPSIQSLAASIEKPAPVYGPAH